MNPPRATPGSARSVLSTLWCQTGKREQKSVAEAFIGLRFQSDQQPDTSPDPQSLRKIAEAASLELDRDLAPEWSL